MRGITFTAAAAATIVLGWMLIAPLFVDQTVDESFALTQADGSLDLEAIRALPEANRRLMRPRIMRTAAETDTKLAESMPSMQTSPKRLASGHFVGADRRHQGSGELSLYATSASEHLLRIENLRVTNGPDLVVYLSKHQNPTKAADVLEAGYLSLGKLKGNIGNQNYPLPTDTPVADYPSVVIWCELFDVLFASASLRTIDHELPHQTQ